MSQAISKPFPNHRSRSALARIGPALLGLAGALLLSVSGPVLAADEKTAEQKALDKPATESALTARVQTLMAEKKVPGVSYAVFDADGVIFTGALGKADIATGRAVTEATQFRIGSITKTLTALALMQLVEQGRVSLDTPITEILPTAPIDNPYAATDPVRLIHLLEHTAGFDDMHFADIYKPHEDRAAHAEALTMGRASLKVRWRPGTMMSYSNPGYAVLGAVLEQLEGKSWEQIISARVLTPLAMTATSLTTAESLHGDYAVGYSEDGDATTGVSPVAPVHIWYRAAGVAWSTVHDLGELGRFLLTDGASHPGLLKPETVQDMKRAHSSAAAKAGLDWGYGLAVFASARHGARFYGHDGGIDGFVANMAFEPQRQLGFVELHNSDSAWGLDRPIAGYIVQQPVLSAPTSVAARHAATTVEALPADAAGWYRFANSRNELLRGVEWLLGVLSLHIEDGKLSIAPLVGNPAIVQAGNGQLLREIESGQLNTVVLRDAQGQVTAVEYDGQHYVRSNIVAALAPVVLFTLALLALVSAPFGRRKALHNRWLRRWPTLALASLVLMFAAVTQLSLPLAGTVNTYTLAIFAGSLLLPLCAVAGLALSLKTWRGETAKVARWRCLLGSVGAAGISAYFAAFHWFALALWAW